MMNKDDPDLGENLIEIVAGDEGWQDVVLPDGALKSGKLDGLIGFQEYVPKKKTKQAQRKRKADILFGQEVKDDKVAKTKKEAKKSRRKKKKKEVLNDDKMEESIVSTDDYIFTNDMNKWKRMNLIKPLLRALDERNLVAPTEVQIQTIPKGLNTKTNILAAAETGSGKTIAFALPIIQKIHGHLEKFGDRAVTAEVEIQTADDESNKNTDFSIFGKGKTKEGPLGLVLCPTRELAVQVHDQIKYISQYTKVRTGVIIGGMSTDKQERVLTKIRPHIIVATPGRFWELQSQGQDFLQNLDLVKYFVVDEADRMAQKGHFEELGSIIAAVGQCQKFIFSATLTLTNKGSKRMEQKNMKADTSEMKLKKLMEIVGVEKKKSEVVDLSNKTLTAKGISEYKISCPSDKDKDHWLYWLLLKKRGRAIVFVNAISCALRLNGLLAPLELPVQSLHANLQQRQRLKHLDRFKSNSNGILISTDVAARGLDIPNVEMIIHFQFPKTAESYVHRSGRSARGGASGEAIVLLSGADYPSYKKVLNTLKKNDLDSFDRSPPPKAISDRLDLALKIDKMSHEKKKEIVEKNWFKKQAELCDIELSDEDSDNEVKKNEDSKREQQINQLKSRLKYLLKTNI